MKGFTFIELVIFLAIVGFIIALGGSFLHFLAAQARDSQRMEALLEVQNQLKHYYEDRGSYPDTNNHSGITRWVSFDANAYKDSQLVDPLSRSSAGDLTAVLAPYGIPHVDPHRTFDDTSGYLYTGGGQDYCFMIYKTPEDLSHFDPKYIDRKRCDHLLNDQCVAQPGYSAAPAIYVGVGKYADGC